MITVFRRPIVACLVAAAIAATLSDCAGLHSSRERSEREQQANVYPDNFKADLLAFLRAYLNDPTGVRDAYVADPVLKTLGSQTRYAVCVKFDAKNSDGRYVGRKEGIAVYAHGRFDQFVDLVKDQCNGSNYQPFPELEALKR